MLVSEENITRPTQVCSTLITLWAGVYENNKTYMGQQWLDTKNTEQTGKLYPQDVIISVQ